MIMKTPRPGASNAQQGFMLLELLISMAVLLVGLGGILIVLITAMYGNNRSSGDTTATMVGEHVIEQISSAPANSTALIPVTDCAGTTWNINPTGAAQGSGSGAHGGNGANLTSAGIIDWTQSYSSVPTNYAMQYVACGGGASQWTYDVRWNIINMSSYAQQVILSARPVPSTQVGGLRFVIPVNLRTIQGM